MASHKFVGFQHSVTFCSFRVLCQMHLWMLPITTFTHSFKHSYKGIRLTENSIYIVNTSNIYLRASSLRIILQQLLAIYSDLYYAEMVGEGCSIKDSH